MLAHSVALGGRGSHTKLKIVSATCGAMLESTMGNENFDI